LRAVWLPQARFDSGGRKHVAANRPHSRPRTVCARLCGGFCHRLRHLSSTGGALSSVILISLSATGLTERGAATGRRDAPPRPALEPVRGPKHFMPRSWSAAASSTPSGPARLKENRQMADPHSHSQWEWHRWFAWHPVVIWIEGEKTTRVWLRQVERKRSRSRYTGEEKWRYRPARGYRAEPSR
jgi:hypothetical protein